MIIFLLIIFVLLLLYPEIAAECVISTCKTWLYKLVPILYPNFILIDFLAENKTLEMLGFYLFKPFHKIFKIRYFKSSVILLLSYICGAPASTKFIKEALDHEDIDEKEADTLVYACSCFSLPYTIFVLNAFQASIPLFFMLYLPTSFILLRRLNSGPCQKKIQLNKDKKKIKSILFSSITKNTDILISILGIMIFFNIVLSLCRMDIRLYSFFEVLNGHSLLSGLEMDTRLKEFILISTLTFLGISVHLQVLYVYPSLKYIRFFLIRLFQSLLVGLGFLLLRFLF